MSKDKIATLIERAERDGVDTALEGNMLLLDLAAALKEQRDEIERLRRRVMALTPTAHSEPLWGFPE